MLTQKQVLDQVKAGKKDRDTCAFIDGHDFLRLSAFFPVSNWKIFGFKLIKGKKAPKSKKWTEKNIKKQLAEDLSFAFEKALNKRGISSGLMYEVIKMWLWILEDPLQESNDYAMYGLPLYKAVALKYNLPNPIGNDVGNEVKYNE